MGKATDWTTYYKKKKSFFSTHTQKYTERLILKAIDDYCSSEVRILECGGGGSCFATSVCQNDKVTQYDIIDNNEFAVGLFNDMELPVKHNGTVWDLTNEGIGQNTYNFVYSIGLIEHFTDVDREKVIQAHMNCCSPGGIVLISFPTPTKKYRIIRKLMEMLRVWQFWDETPLTEDRVRPIMERHGCINECFINKKLPLTQMIIIMEKGKVEADR